MHNKASLEGYETERDADREELRDGVPDDFVEVVSCEIEYTMSYRVKDSAVSREDLKIEALGWHLSEQSRILASRYMREMLKDTVFRGLGIVFSS